MFPEQLMLPVVCWDRIIIYAFPCFWLHLRKWMTAYLVAFLLVRCEFAEFLERGEWSAYYKPHLKHRSQKTVRYSHRSLLDLKPTVTIPDSCCLSPPLRFTAGSLRLVEFLHFLLSLFGWCVDLDDCAVVALRLKPEENLH